MSRSGAGEEAWCTRTVMRRGVDIYVYALYIYVYIYSYIRIYPCKYADVVYRLQEYVVLRIFKS